MKYRSLSESGSHTVIFPATYSELSYHYIKQLTHPHSQPSYSLEDTLQLYQYDDYFEFIPVYKGSLRYKGDTIVFANTCFKNTKATLKEISSSKLTLELEAQDPYSPLCSDDFLIALIRQRETETIFWSGIHLVEFEGLREDDAYDIMKNGVRLFSLKDNYISTVNSAINTAEMFLGGLTGNTDIPVLGSKVPDYMVEANLEFLAQNMNLDIEKRFINKIDLAEDFIKSGDMLGLMRMDGFSTLIMYATGGMISHTAMALWMEENGKRNLYVVESQFGPFTPHNGVQKTLYSKWIQLMNNADYNVVLIKLDDFSRLRFNEKLAIMEFNELEGLPYGFHNLVYGWIDTPDHNFPKQFSPELIEVALRIIEEVMPDVIEKTFGEALNIRLQTQNLTIDQLVIKAAMQNLTLAQVMAMPERDSWSYSDGKSFTCSALLSHIYRASGILSHVYFEATELTPRDLYSLNLFDTLGTNRPSACIEADPNLPYCQLIGDFRIDLTSELSSRSPYHYMFEGCESQAPKYTRSKSC